MRLAKTVCVLGIFALASCSVGYGPADEIGGIPTGGYADSRVNGNTAIVNIQGNQYTCQGLVRTYLMYRCAQVTLANGYDYFIISSSSLSSANLNVNEVDILHPVDNPPRLFDTYYTTKQFTSYSYGPRGKVVRGCGASAVIKMFNGAAPRGMPNAFNAESMIANSGPGTFH